VAFTLNHLQRYYRILCTMLSLIFPPIGEILPGVGTASKLTRMISTDAFLEYMFYVSLWMAEQRIGLPDTHCFSWGPKIKGTATIFRIITFLL